MSKRGFTLVELMVTIAIIGILAAVLYPSLSGYLSRGRDSNRITHLTQISRALTAYSIDNQWRYPPHDTGCVSQNHLTSYISLVPTSPSGRTYDEGCGSNGRYGYGQSNQGYILIAQMEGDQTGNYSGTILGFTGDIIGSALASSLAISRGVGSSYVVSVYNQSMASTTPTEGIPPPPPPPPPPTNYTITWDSQSGTVISPTTFALSDVFLIPTMPPTRSGYTFGGWYTSAAGGGLQITNSSTPTTSATYYAKWTLASPYVQCTAAGQTYIATTIYPSCNEPDKIICTANGVGYTWAMCNVGSTTAGTTSASYGSYFQWGRNQPFPSSGTVTTTAGPVSLATANATTNFITNPSGTNNYDWLTPQDSTLWGASSDTDTYATVTSANQTKMQGPCALGYHVPTYKEANDTIATGLGNNFTTFNTALKLPLSGYRNGSVGSSGNQGGYGYWWLSSPGSTYGRLVYWSSSAVNPSSNAYRANGFGVRCVRN